jgi:hypothetical protein
MIRTSIYLSNQQLRLLREESQKRDLSVSELVRRAIDLYLEDKEAGAPAIHAKR